ncbi:hypothetical protein MMYC01_207179 [Madurella mycetomatis]|uniref:Uncharacterized protein n=1 Tax=Madurella mycetomatis TaxID=100816 RepID=A0A175VYL6_9PEZI|nr:hypothetical protein MMYC01_207179 [Madurella mycetomatis]
MSRTPILNHSHWDTIDLGDTNAHKANSNPDGELDPPVYHHIYFPRYHDEKQATFTEEEDCHSETASSINADFFPLPPTYSQRLSLSSGYHTFTLLESPTTTLSGAGSDDDLADLESCYFETLDFEDYMHPNANPNDNNNHPAGSKHTKPASAVTVRQLLAPSSSLHQRRLRRNRRNRRSHCSPHHHRHQGQAVGGRLRKLYTSIAGSELELDTATAEKLGLQPGTAWRLGRGWRAVRKTVGVLCLVLLVVSVLVAAGWAATSMWGVLRTMASGVWGDVKSTTGGGGSWGNGSPRLCGEVRSRFCRVVHVKGVGR